MTKSNNNRFVDLRLAEVKPSLKKRALGEYRICSVTKRGHDRFINLRIPTEMQDKIVRAYAQGKQVRIFA